jgi:hypothetical protein
LQTRDHVGNVALAYVKRGVVVDQIVEVIFKLTLVLYLVFNGEALHVHRHVLCILLGKADEDTREVEFIFRHQLAHHAEINERNHSILPHKYVSRMRVGMKKAVLKNLGKVNAHAIFSNLRRIKSPRA